MSLWTAPMFFHTTLPPLTFPVLLLAFGIGVVIGVFYFGGLWWTTQQVPHRRSPALWLLGSFALRTILAVMGFYLVMQGRPERLLVCLFGFWIARLVCVRTLGQIAAVPRKASPSPAPTDEPQTLSTTDGPQTTALTNPQESTTSGHPAASLLHKPQSPLE